tara:strand:- start:44 stop:466 length:423 start_codon:yes stop_codon:yes gene_type:complete
MFHIFNNKKIKHTKNIDIKIVKFFIFHISLILFFAIFYYLIDLWMFKHPDLAVKYFLTEYALDDKREKNILQEDLLSVKPFFYHLYFSAITQTTLGYGGQTDGRGQNIPILMKDVIFQVINFIQICSIFMIPLLVMFSKD